MRTLDEMMDELYGPARRSARFASPALLPEDDSLLMDVAGSGLSALQYIGQSLDKPGRAVRGLLGGHPEELLNAIPFSSGMGLTDPNGLLGDYIAVTNDRNYTSGRDLLRDYDLIGDRDTWGNFAGGLGVELATDPLSYLTLGTGTALSRAGQVASRAGALPGTAVGRMGGSLRGLLDDAGRLAADTGGTQLDDLTARLTAAAGPGGLTDDLLDAPLSGMMGFGLPFSRNTSILNPGPRSMALGQFVDDNYDLLKYADTGFYGNVLGRGVQKGRELFDSSLRGAAMPATHRAMDMVPDTGRNVADTVANRQAQSTMGLYGDVDLLRQAGINPMDPQTAERLLMAKESTWAGAPPTVEARQQMAQAAGMPLHEMAVREAFRNAGLDDAQISAVSQVVGRHTGAFAESLLEKQRMGFTTPELTDETITYSPRSMHSEHLSQRQPGAQSTAPTFTRSDIGRSQATRKLAPTAEQPGGTTSLSRMMADPELGQSLERSVRSDLLDLPSEQLAARFMEEAEMAGVGNRNELLENATSWQTSQMLEQLRRGEAPTLVQRPPRNPADRAARQSIERVYRNYMAFTPAEADANLARMRDLMRQQNELAEQGGALDDASAEFLEAMRANLNQARLHASWIRNLPADAQYDPRIFDVAKGALDRSAQQAEMGKAVHRALVHGGEFLDNVDPAMRTQIGPNQPMVSALDVLAQAGMRDRTQAVRFFAETLAELRPEVLSEHFGDDWIRLIREEGDNAELLSWLDKWVVPDDLARDLTKVMDFTNDPQSVRGILGIWDRMTSVLKSNLTSPWPAFASRNLQSLFWMDGVAGGFQNPGNMLHWWGQTQRFLRGDTIEGAAQMPGIRELWM